MEDFCNGAVLNKFNIQCVIGKPKKKIICGHFLIDGTCKKATGSQNILSFMKSDGPIVILLVVLPSILVPCD